MATYKVLQDIEAEDKLVGALTLRQFIYGGVAAFCFYMCFIFITKGVAFLTIAFLPPGLFCAFFAFPFGRDQPTEVWALAKIRFYLKPRKRIWDQSGVKELVTVTVPKHIEKVYTNGLTQTEVQSRLNALANTIDSRGWAIKNVNVNLSTPAGMATLPEQSDRLVDMSSMPQEVSNVDVTASDDMLDAYSNPIAQQFDAMLAKSAQEHRQQIVQQLESSTPPAATPQAPADYWFLNQPTPSSQAAPVDATYIKPQMVFPGADDTTAAAIPAAEPTESEEALIARIKAQGTPRKAAYSHLKNIHPIGEQTQPPQSQTPPVTATPDPAKIELARNNDLNISTIARLANKKQPPDDEVVISLH
ncbi:MAG: PrgI family protein [Candidatus Saccharimonadales bacterium]